MKTPYFTYEWDFSNISNIYFLESQNKIVIYFSVTTKLKRSFGIDFDVTTCEL